MITTKKEAEKLWDIAVQCACDDINKEQTPEHRKKVIEKFRKTLDKIVNKHTSKPYTNSKTPDLA